MATVMAAAMLSGSAGLGAFPTASAAQIGGEVPGPSDVPGASGSWGPVENWPLVAIHSALDSKGRVLTYGTDGNGTQTGRFIYDVWTPGPSAGAGHATLANTTATDLFCSLQINRPDNGDMVLFGGDNWVGTSTNNLGNPDINNFDPDTNQLTALPGMVRSRWYGTGTTLPDGSIYIQGGDGGYDRPELWTPDGGSRLLPFETAGLNWWYPRNFVLPDGRIFGVDVNGYMYYVAADLSGITMAGRLSADRWGYGTTAVMFEPGRILHFGGSTDTAIIIDVNGAAPVVTPTDTLSTARDWVDGTLLPDGRILATGGAANYEGAQTAQLPLAAFGVNNTAEIWDPATGQWTVETTGVRPRLYHSTSLLLPDGRVLVAGGGAPGPVTNTNAELFSPDYLTTAGGQPTTRPVITGLSSTELLPGEAVTIEVESGVGIGRVTLLKTGSVTHSNNMEQRIADLGFTVDGSTIATTVPGSNTQVTPGYYLLTVLTTEGVPSESRIVRIGADGPVGPTAPAPASSTGAQVQRLYQAYFGRQADAAGLAYWVGRLQAGMTLAQVSDYFASGAEFYAAYGALTDGEFVDRVYQNVLGRAADDAGRSYWIGRLAAGMSRGAVMVAFSESPEFIALTGGGAGPAPAPPTGPTTPAGANYRPAVHRLYLAYFLREPDEAGLAYWVSQRVAGLPLVEVSDAFASSAEFQASYGATSDEEFVDLVYANVLERPADADGRAYWLWRLANGLSRGEMMTGFSESAEFTTKVGPIG